MGYLVLARKYRPQTFADLVGQEHIARTLGNAIDLKRVAHAFLFTGVRGVGKTSTARILAKALNCEKGPSPSPCNACTACQEITQGISADVLEIDGASNRGIDSIRELRESVRYLPRSGAFRIFIIDEVHMLTQESFNALLKTLEEPPPHVKFIFATTESHKIPITILSRCQRFDFHRIPTRELQQRIKDILQRENIEIEAIGIARIARAADGSMRDALSLLDQVISFAGTNVSADAVSEALGSADNSRLYALADAILSRNPASVLHSISEVFRRGYDLGQFAEDLLALFRDLVAVKAGGAADELGDDERSDLEKLLKNKPLPELIRAFQLLSKTCEELARASNPKIVLEVSLTRLATLPPLLPWDELLARLERLEASLESDGPPPKHAEAPRLGSAPQEPKHSFQAQAPVTPSVSVVAPVRTPEPRASSTPLVQTKPLTAEEWATLLQKLGTQYPMQAAPLSNASFVACIGNKIQLAFPPESLHATLVTGTLSRIEENLSVLYGSPLSLEIATKEGADTDTPYLREQKRLEIERQKRSAETLRHPAIKETLRAFGLDDTAVKTKLDEPTQKGS